ncbi:MAG: hypothetical protein JWN70_545 [Planctomycetaceae bacterium]|nr:hypothetical protein [Planctomycetaceae bacterium]
MSVRAVLIVPALALALFATGCGGGSVEKLVPVGGKLVVDGEALDGVIVTFIPEASQKERRGGAGTTDASGVFTVTDLGQNLPGLPAGKYTVAYSRPRLPNGAAFPKAEPGKPIDPGIVRVESLPAHLTTPNQNLPTSQVEIPKEGNTNLELKISKRSSR